MIKIYFSFLLSLRTWRKSCFIQYKDYINSFIIKYVYLQFYFSCNCLPYFPPLKSSFTTVSGEQPDLPQLLKIDLPAQVAPEIGTFGTLLLNDGIGNKMAIIRQNSNYKPQEMAVEVLREWLLGRGVKVTWESLISTLKDSKLQLTANSLQMALNELKSQH